MSGKRVVLEIDRDGLTGGLQVSIGLLNDIGYRFYGPKYNGSSKNLARVFLTKDDAARIKEFLRYVEE